jgi:signal peptidase I
MRLFPGYATPGSMILCSQLWVDLSFNSVVQDENSSSGKPGPQAGWVQLVLIGRRPKATLLRILVLVAVCAVTFKFVLLPIRVEGISMEPTYHNHRVDCVNRLAYRWRQPQRGDVVAIRFSKPGALSNPSEMLMKRIVALPGESISFHNGHIYINGELLDEPYLKNPCDWEHEAFTCGPDQYYVVGDNRSMPFEFHTQGRVERDHIVGKVLL